MGRLWFGLLGPTVVVGDAGEIVVRGSVRRRLLTRLLVAAGHPVTMDRLIDDVWERRAPPADTRSNLKSHVSLLRQALGGGVLVFRDGAYVLDVPSESWDVGQFRGAAAAGGNRLHSGDPAAAVRLLGEALDFWRGPALVEVADSTWGGPEAVRLEEQRLAVFEDWLEARLLTGETHSVVSDAETAIASSPYREGIWAKLITALYRGGRQADALRAYRRLQRILGEDLGITPSPVLVDLEAAVLRHQVPPGPGPGLAVGSESPSPPDEPDSGADRVRAERLPPELTSYIDRPGELTRVIELLDAPGLVTLTGTGGTGKTRLALRAAQARVAAGHEVWFCALAALDDPGYLVDEVAATMGCADQVGGELVATIAGRLERHDDLLVLDNCEHLIGGAASFANTLRQLAPTSRLLVTSRAPLEVEGEVVYRVPSMSVPGASSPAGELMGFESVRLFVERARSQRADFVLDAGNRHAVAALCRRLDGLPLAIELAAARSRSMSPDDIARRLDHRFAMLTGGPRAAPARQQTLRALIDWSFDLLEPDERDGFARLSVFAGSFDLAGAEAVLPSVTRPPLDVLASLVDWSLVQMDVRGETARYRMLETVRAYAAEKLADTDRPAVRDGHAAYYLERVELAAPHFFHGDQARWRTRLDLDHDDLQAAFATLISGREADAALRFGAAVSRYWNSRGNYGHEVELLDTALDRPDAVGSTAARSAALAAAGYLHFRRGELARAESRLDEALEIADHLGSARLQADALRTLAWVAERRGEHDPARELAERALERAHVSAESHLIARAFDVRAAAVQDRDPVAARRDYEEALRYCEDAGDGLGQASALNNMAILALEQGEHELARRHFGLAYAIAQEVRDSALLPFIEYGIGLAAILEGDEAAATAAFTGALRAARHTGQESLVGYALLGIGAAWVRGGRLRDGAALLGASESVFAALGQQPEPIEVRLWERAMADLSEALGDDGEAAVRSGRDRPMAAIIRMATDTL
jgi:predicted ATPase/DNA-binding SARP family transcriptional activator